MKYRHTMPVVPCMKFPRTPSIALIVSLVFALDARAGIRIGNLDGNIVSVPDPSAKATVVVFVSPECPISNRAIPTLNALAARSGIRFAAAISDPTISRKSGAEWAGKFGIHFPVLFDSSGELARD